MYAVAFDLVIGDLRRNYGESYPNAYYEVREKLKTFGFEWTQGSVYLSSDNNLANVYKAIKALSLIDWFRNSVRDIRVFRVEDWSDFTQVVKGNE